MQFRLGVVGLGNVSKAHLDASTMLPDVRIEAICDVARDRADAVAKRFSARPFYDYRDMLATGGLDLVMVLTPAATHAEVVLAAAEAGVHVLCEKPLALSILDAKAMVEACDEAGVKLFYGSSYRYMPAVARAHELIQSGAIGRIQLMTEQVIGGAGPDCAYQLSPVHCPPGGPGGPALGIVDHGIHLIDVFSWFAGAEIANVQGFGNVSGEQPGSELMVIRFSSGAIGHLLYNALTFCSVLPNEGMFSGGQSWRFDYSVTEPGFWDPEPGSISVYGTKGSLRICHYANALHMNSGLGPQRIELTGRPPFGHFATQLEDCIAAIRVGRPPAVSGRDGLTALKAMLAVYPADAEEEQRG